MTFLASEVALCLNKSSIRPCVEYCCHVWVGALGCFLELLDKLQERIILKGGLLVILIDCINILSPFLDVTRISMSAVSLLAQLGS